MNITRSTRRSKLKRLGELAKLNRKLMLAVISIISCLSLLVVSSIASSVDLALNIDNPISYVSDVAFDKSEMDGEFEFYIRDYKDLQMLSTLVNNDAVIFGSDYKYADARYILLNDIEFPDGETLTPIGYSVANGYSFRGVFDGKGYKIKNLVIEDADGFTGLFGAIKNATIKNFTIESGSITSNGNYVGSVVGYAYLGTIKNIINYATVSSTGLRVGGIIGGIENNVTIEGVANYGAVEGNYYVGGVAGSVSENVYYGTKLIESANLASVSGAYAGGLVGRISNSLTADENNTKHVLIENCFNSGDVTGSYASGLVAEATAGNEYARIYLTNAFSVGVITGSNASTINAKNSVIDEASGEKSLVLKCVFYLENRGGLHTENSYSRTIAQMTGNTMDSSHIYNLFNDSSVWVPQRNGVGEYKTPLLMSARSSATLYAITYDPNKNIESDEFIEFYTRYSSVTLDTIERSGFVLNGFKVAYDSSDETTTYIDGSYKYLAGTNWIVQVLTEIEEGVFEYVDYIYAPNSTLSGQYGAVTLVADWKFIDLWPVIEGMPIIGYGESHTYKVHHYSADGFTYQYEWSCDCDKCDGVISLDNSFTTESLFAGLHNISVMVTATADDGTTFSESATTQISVGKKYIFVEPFMVGSIIYGMTEDEIYTQIGYTPIPEFSPDETLDYSNFEYLFYTDELGVGELVPIREVSLAPSGTVFYIYVSGIESENHIIESNYITTEIQKRDISITTGSESKIYDGTELYLNNATMNCTLPNGDVISYSNWASITNVGTTRNSVEATIEYVGGGDATGNYNITYNFGTLTISQLPITVQINGEMNYGSSSFVPEFAVTGTESMDVIEEIINLFAYGNDEFATNIFYYVSDGNNEIYNLSNLTAGEYLIRYRENRTDTNFNLTLVEGTLLVKSITRTVTLHPNGGTLPTGTENTLTVTIPGVYGELPTPTREHFVFAGWWDCSLDENQNIVSYDNHISENSVINTLENHNLYAKWTPIAYTITLNSNGGHIAHSGFITYTIESSRVELPTTSRVGYIFTGWMVESSVGTWTENETFNSEIILTSAYGNVTLIAQYISKTIKVEFELDGGTLESDCIFVEYENVYGYYSETQDGTKSQSELPVPSKSGYEFNGWYLNANCIGETITPETSVRQFNNHTLYASWVPVGYTVSLDPNGGYVCPTAIIETIEGTITLPRPTRVGYNFLHWEVVSTDGSWIIGTEYSGGAEISGEYGDVTLSAVWSIETFNLTINPTAGGTVNTTLVNYTILSTDKIDGSSLTGYTFIGYKNLVNIASDLWTIGSINYEQGTDDNISKNNFRSPFIRAQDEVEYTVTNLVAGYVFYYDEEYNYLGNNYLSGLSFVPKTGTKYIRFISETKTGVNLDLSGVITDLDQVAIIDGATNDHVLVATYNPITYTIISPTGNDLLQNGSFESVISDQNIGWDNSINGTLKPTHGFYSQFNPERPGAHAHIVDSGEQNHGYVFEFNKNESNSWLAIQYNFATGVITNGKYIVSVDAKLISGNSYPRIGLAYYTNSNSTSISYASGFGYITNITNEWARYSWVFDVDDIDTSKGCGLLVMGHDSNGVFYLDNVSMYRATTETGVYDEEYTFTAPEESGKTFEYWQVSNLTEDYNGNYIGREASTTNSNVLSLENPVSTQDAKVLATPVYSSVEYTINITSNIGYTNTIVASADKDITITPTQPGYVVSGFELVGEYNKNALYKLGSTYLTINEKTSFVGSSLTVRDLLTQRGTVSIYVTFDLAEIDFEIIQSNNNPIYGDSNTISVRNITVGGQAVNGVQFTPSVQYKIEGRTYTSLNYTNLTPGTYVFEVVVVVDDGSGKAETKSATKTGEFTVAKKQISLDLDYSVDSVYGVSAVEQIVVNGLINQDTITLSATNAIITSDYQLISLQNLEVGTHTITISLNDYRYELENALTVTLTINAREITVVADSESRPYDQTVLVNTGYTILDTNTNEVIYRYNSKTGQIEGNNISGLTVNISGSITYVGTVANVVTTTLHDDVKNRYITTNVNGSLTITQRIVVIEAESYEMEYCGRSYDYMNTPDFVVVFGEIDLDGDGEIDIVTNSNNNTILDSVMNIYYSGYGESRVGVYETKITDLVIEGYEDVSDCYQIICISGTGRIYKTTINTAVDWLKDDIFTNYDRANYSLGTLRIYETLGYFSEGLLFGMQESSVVITRVDDGAKVLEFTIDHDCVSRTITVNGVNIDVIYRSLDINNNPDNFIDYFGPTEYYLIDLEDAIKSFGSGEYVATVTTTPIEEMKDCVNSGTTSTDPSLYAYSITLVKNDEGIDTVEFVGDGILTTSKVVEISDTEDMLRAESLPISIITSRKLTTSAVDPSKNSYLKIVLADTHKNESTGTYVKLNKLNVDESYRFSYTTNDSTYGKIVIMENTAGNSIIYRNGEVVTIKENAIYEMYFYTNASNSDYSGTLTIEYTDISLNKLLDGGVGYSHVNNFNLYNHYNYLIQATYLYGLTSSEEVTIKATASTAIGEFGGFEFDQWTVVSPVGTQLSFIGGTNANSTQTSFYLPNHDVILAPISNEGDKYNITYNWQDEVISDSGVPSGSFSTQYTEIDAIILPENVSINGAEFVGWVLLGTPVYAPGSTIVSGYENWSNRDGSRIYEKGTRWNKYDENGQVVPNWNIIPSGMVGEVHFSAIYASEDYNIYVEFSDVAYQSISATRNRLGEITTITQIPNEEFVISAKYYDVITFDAIVRGNGYYEGYYVTISGNCEVDGKTITKIKGDILVTFIEIINTGAEYSINYTSGSYDNTGDLLKGERKGEDYLDFYNGILISLSNERNVTFSVGGYKIIGWSFEDDGTVDFSAGSTISAFDLFVDNCNITLYAVYGPIAYQIQMYNTSYVLINTISYTIKDSFSISNYYTVTNGYTFNHWAIFDFEYEVVLNDYNSEHSDGKIYIAGTNIQVGSVTGGEYWYDLDYCDDMMHSEFKEMPTFVQDMYGNIKIVACETPIWYTIKVDPNGGTLSSSNGSDTLNYNPEIGIEFDSYVDDPIKNGYTFLYWEVVEADEYSNWTIGAIYNSVRDGEFGGYYGNVTLRAVYGPADRYTISFITNGGESQIPEMTYTVTDSVQLPESQKDGYYFLCWRIFWCEGEESCNWGVPGDCLSGGYSSGMYGNLILEAIWEPKEVTVIFQNLSSAGIAYEGSIYVNGEAYVHGEAGTGFGSFWVGSQITITAVKGSNLQFGYWVNNQYSWTKVYSTENSFTYTITESDGELGTIYIIAVYTYTVRVEAVGKGMVGLTESDAIINDNYIDNGFGEYFTNREVSVIYDYNGYFNGEYYISKNARPYMNFVGWYKDRDCTQTVNNAFVNNVFNESAINMVNEYGEICLYAKFEGVSFSITLNAGDGYLKDANGNDVHILTLYVENGMPISYYSLTQDGQKEHHDNLPIPTQIGYWFFWWWFDDISDGYTVIYENYVFDLEYNQFMLDLEIFAEYEVQLYQVKFDTNGGYIVSGNGLDYDSTTGTYSTTVIYDTRYGTLPTAKRYGYRFLGWVLPDNLGGTKVTSSTYVSIAGDHTLVAEWDVINFDLYLQFDEFITNDTDYMIFIGDSEGNLYGKMLFSDGNLVTVTSSGLSIRNGEILDGNSVFDMIFSYTYCDDIKYLTITFVPTNETRSYSISEIYWCFNEVNSTTYEHLKVYEVYEVTFDENNTNVPADPEAFESNIEFWHEEYEDDKIYHGSEITLNIKTLADVPLLGFTGTKGYKNAKTGEWITSEDVWIEYDQDSDSWKMREDGDYCYYTYNLGSANGDFDFELTSVVTIKITLQHNGENCDENLEKIYVELNAPYKYYGESPFDEKEEHEGLPTPIKNGYKFIGWSLDPDAFELVTGDNKVATQKPHTLYGFYEEIPISYTITYDLSAGGTLEDGSTNPQGYTVIDNIEFKTATKPGVVFAGWKVKESVGNWEEGTVYTAGTTLDDGKYGDVTLVPIWGQTEFTITFDENGGTLPDYVENPMKYSIEDTIELPLPEKVGYTFVGWKVKETVGNWVAGTVYTAGTTLDDGMYGDVTLVAQWTPIEYTISFDPNGGEMSAIGKKRYTIEHQIEFPASPTRDGYTFAGWKVKESVGNWVAGTVYKAGTTLTEMYGNVTLVAEWTPIEYTITFKPDGSCDSIDDYKSQNITSLPTLSSFAYDFVGWKVVEAEGNWISLLGRVLAVNWTPSVGTISEVMYGDVTLEAQWTGKNWGWEILGSSNTGSYTTGNYIDLPVPTAKDGYENPRYEVNSDEYGVLNGGVEFTTTTNDKGVAVIRVTNKNGTELYGHIVFKLLQDPISYTIKYYSDGNKIYEQEYNIESTIVLKAAEEEGYAFMYWKVRESVGNWVAGTEYTDGTTLTGMYGNVELDAEWEPVKYTIVVDGGEGFTEGEKDVFAGVQFGSMQKIGQEFKKAGYRFAGWKITVTNLEDKTIDLYDKAEYGETIDTCAEISKFLDENNILTFGKTQTEYNYYYRNLTSTNGATVTFVAQWEPLPYEITFDLDGGELPSGTDNPMEYNIESTITLPVPTKKGYDFVGWKVKESVGNWEESHIYEYSKETKKFDPETLTQMYGNVTLEAQWEAKKYTVYLDFGFGIDKVTLEFEYGNEEKNTFSNISDWERNLEYDEKHYQFMWWSTINEGILVDGNKTPDPTKNINSDIDELGGSKKGKSDLYDITNYLEEKGETIIILYAVYYKLLPSYTDTETGNTYYLIQTGDDLIEMSRRNISGSSGNKINYIVTNDITMDSEFNYSTAETITETNEPAGTNYYIPKTFENIIFTSGNVEFYGNNSINSITFKEIQTIDGVDTEVQVRHTINVAGLSCYPRITDQYGKIIVSSMNNCGNGMSASGMFHKLTDSTIQNIDFCFEGKTNNYGITIHGSNYASALMIDGKNIIVSNVKVSNMTLLITNDNKDHNIKVGVIVSHLYGGTNMIQGVEIENVQVDVDKGDNIPSGVHLNQNNQLSIGGIAGSIKETTSTTIKEIKVLNFSVDLTVRNVASGSFAGGIVGDVWNSNITINEGIVVDTGAMTLINNSTNNSPIYAGGIAGFIRETSGSGNNVRIGGDVQVNNYIINNDYDNPNKDDTSSNTGGIAGYVNGSNVIITGYAYETHNLFDLDEWKSVLKGLSYKYGDKSDSYPTVNGTINIDENSVTVTANKAGVSVFNNYNNYAENYLMPVVPGQTYTISWKQSTHDNNADPMIWYWEHSQSRITTERGSWQRGTDSSGCKYGNISYGWGSSINTLYDNITDKDKDGRRWYSFTIPDNAYYISLRLGFGGSTSANQSITFSDIRISNALACHGYSPNSANIYNTKIYGVSRVGGVVGYMEGNAKIGNINISGSTVHGLNNVGGIVGRSMGYNETTDFTEQSKLQYIDADRLKATISCCTISSSTISAWESTGKGYDISSSGLIENASLSTYVGGIAGYMWQGSVIACEVIGGNVHGSKGGVGGIVGGAFNVEAIYGCFNSAKVTSIDNYNNTSKYVKGIGGIVGIFKFTTSDNLNTNEALIKNCTNNGVVIGFRMVGGIVGYAQNTNTLTGYTLVDSCANHGNIYNVEPYDLEPYGSDDSYDAGGIVGKMLTYGLIIKNSYNTGTITSAYRLGGIVGSIGNYNNKIINCFTTGLFSNLVLTSNNVNDTIDSYELTNECGYIVGEDFNDSATIENCYYYNAVSNEINATNPFKADGKVLTFSELHNLGGDTTISRENGWNAGENVCLPKLLDARNDDHVLLAPHWLFEKDGDLLLIQNLQDLNILADAVNNGWNAPDGKPYSEKKYKVTNDIGDSDNKFGNIIGSTSKPFTGNFDGNKKTINVNISSTRDYVGLFGYVEKATIQNVTISGTIKGNNYVGGLVGYAGDETKILNSVGAASVTGYSHVGGIVGVMNKGSEISSCVVELGYNITATTDGATTDSTYYTHESRVGGIAGLVYDTQITGCTNKAKVSGNTWCIGGLVGIVWDDERVKKTEIKDSKNNGLVECATTGKHAIGGLVGFANYITISSSSNSGTISASGSVYVGGLVGWINKAGEIKASGTKETSNSGEVIGSSYVGGLVGYANGTIEIVGTDNGGYLYNSGSIEGTNYIGGFVGYVNGTTKAIIRGDSKSRHNCYNNGQITGKKYVGGIIGYIVGSSTSTTIAAANKDAYNATFAILDLQNKGEVTGEDTVGGIVGYAKNIDILCWLANGHKDEVGNNGDINGGSDGARVGGIVGKMEGIQNSSQLSIINDCYNAESVTCFALGGGIAGNIEFVEIRACRNLSIISGDNDIGGIVGDVLNSIILNSSNTAEINANSKAGGIVGDIVDDSDSVAAKIEGCNNSGNVGLDINNVTLDNYYIGGIVGCASETTIKNNANYGTVSGYQKVGGIVGCAKYNCIISFSAGYGNSGTVTGVEYIGGIVGRMSGGSITGGGSNVYVNIGEVSSGELTGDKVVYNVGGIAGEINSVTINECKNNGMVNGFSNVGGIVGHCYSGTIKLCDNDGSISGTKEIGGISGWSYNSTINTSNNYGDITGKRSVGGILGRANDVSLIDCWNLKNGKNDINGTESHVGGIVGCMYGGSTIKGCSNTMFVNSIKAYVVGGIAGYLSSDSVLDNTEAGYYNISNSGSVVGSAWVGGIVGESNGKIIGRSGAYIENKGAVSGGRNVGGIAGCHDNSSSDDTINYVYNRGDVFCIATNATKINERNIAFHGYEVLGYGISVKIKSGWQGHFGGVVGWLYNSNINNVYSYGDVVVDSEKALSSIVTTYETAYSFKIEGAVFGFGGIVGRATNSNIKNAIIPESKVEIGDYGNWEDCSKGVVCVGGFIGYWDGDCNLTSSNAGHATINIYGEAFLGGIVGGCSDDSSGGIGTGITKDGAIKLGHVNYYTNNVRYNADLLLRDYLAQMSIAYKSGIGPLEYVMSYNVDVNYQVTIKIGTEEKDPYVRSPGWQLGSGAED